MATMDFPNLAEEIYIEDPLKDLKLEEVIKEDLIGVAECEVIAPDIKLGYLPIRYKNTIFFPTNKSMTGTWTILELREAMKLGYEIKKMNWCCVYPRLDDNLFTSLLIRCMR